MRTYIVAFLLSALTTLVLTPALRGAALRFGWMDEPDHRKVHETPIPRIGGVAIAIAFFVPVLALTFLDNKISAAYLDDQAKLIGLGVGALVTVLLGLFDDLRSLSALQKLPVQIAVAGLAWAAGFQIAAIGNPFGAPIELGWLGLPLTLLWIVGIMNAINLVDGLDGLAGGVALFALATLFVIGVVKGNPILSLTTVALAGALMGFLRHNFNPATIFMGDSGSLFLGYVIAVTSIWSSAKSSTVVSLAIPIVILGLPILDTSMSMFRRMIRGKSPFSADREHIHHKLLDMGLSQRQAVLTLYGGSVLLAGAGLVLMFANAAVSAAVLGGVIVAAIVASKALGYLSFSNMSRSVQYGLLRRHRLESTVNELARAEAAIRQCSSLEEVLDEVMTVAEQSDLRVARCEISVDYADTRQVVRRTWPEGGQISAEAHRFDLSWQLEIIEVEGTLEVEWPELEPNVHPPSAALFQWLARLVRDRAVEIVVLSR